MRVLRAAYPAITDAARVESVVLLRHILEHERRDDGDAVSTRVMPGALPAARSAASRCSHEPTLPLSVATSPSTLTST
jgi:hypothetical protein